MKHYRPSGSAWYGKDQAQEIGECLEQLDLVVPKSIIEEATKTSSPLHKYFEWDDSAAARKYRVNQAVHLVNHLEVRVKIAGDWQYTKAFHSIAISKNNQNVREYVAISFIKQSQVMMDSVQETALRQLTDWYGRYKEYTGIFGRVFEEIDNVVREETRELARASV